MATWMAKWTPEDLEFWEAEGKRTAWRTLAITTLALTLSFSTWFVMSAVVVRLPFTGFDFTSMQLFWLAAMPGLAAGTLRIVNMFLIPIYGSRHVITISTFLKVLPMAWLAVAVMNPTTPYWQFLMIAFLCGLGGGDFSSYMPSTSLFFPKRLQGVALGVQAGIGNFGVSLTQFLTPWIIGFAAFGAMSGAPQQFAVGDSIRETWLQNAGLVYIPILIVTGILCWVLIRSVPVRATLLEQTDIFRSKHTWFCTITYVMTFGSFSGFAAAFPLMIREIYGGFENAPDPLVYAFYGPLIGSIIRVVMGAPSDRWGGSIFTQLSGAGLILGCIALLFGGYLQPESAEQFPGFVAIMLWMFFWAGVGNASTFRQFPIIFAHSPRQTGGVIGWTAAVAAYGPFVFALAIGAAFARTGSPVPFFWAAMGFYIIASVVNWTYYTKKGAERFDWGSRGGTWWDAERLQRESTFPGGTKP